MSRGAGRRRAAAAALALLAASPRWARAQQTEPPKSPLALPARSAQIVLDGRTVRASFAFRDALDGETSKKLLSGLPTVIAMRGYLFREAGGDPVALTAKSCRIVYDLWDEIFRIQLTQPGGETNALAVNVEGVLRICGEARRIEIAPRALLADDGRYFIAALVEVNPVSPEMLDRIKRWVTRPNGTAAIGPGDSLFGSFVGLFVARIDEADRKLVFRTEAFSPPTAPPPP